MSHPNTRTAPPQPRNIDRRAFADFATRLGFFEGWTAFQTFPEAPGASGAPRIFHAHDGEIEQADFAEMERLNRVGHGVFVMVNAGDGNGRRTPNVTRIRALFVDLDGAPLEPILTSPRAPHVIVESSPGKFHAYWRVSGCPPHHFKARQQALAARFGGDPAVCDLARVMRAPGFRHLKAEPFQTRLLVEHCHDGPPYSVEELVEELVDGLGLNLSEGGKGAPKSASPDGLPPGERVKAGGRNAFLTSMGAKFIDTKFSESEIRGFLHAADAEHCDPPVVSEGRDDPAILAKWVIGKRGESRSKGQNGECAREVELISGDCVTPARIDWLWQDYLPAGKLVIIAGAPGTGKTTVALSLIATITRGGEWPDGEIFTCGQSGNVVIWSGEDDIATTLIVRLRAANADVAKVHFVNAVKTVNGGSRPFDPATDIAELAEKIRAVGNVRLVLVDPIVSAVAGDSHKNAEVRRGLQPLVNLGHDTGACIVGVSHFSKGTAGRDPLERVTGSLAFGALARVAFATAKRDENVRAFLRVKNNLGPDGGGFDYTLGVREVGDRLHATAVKWGGRGTDHRRRSRGVGRGRSRGGRRSGEPTGRGRCLRGSGACWRPRHGERS